MRNGAAALVLWLAALLACSVLEQKTISEDFWHTNFFFTCQLPLWGLVLFGSYALMSVGWHLLVLEDCNAAHDELVEQIKVAKADLAAKGVKL